MIPKSANDELEKFFAEADGKFKGAFSNGLAEVHRQNLKDELAQLNGRLAELEALAPAEREATTSERALAEARVIEIVGELLED
jgi:hypothetical protein